MPSRYLALTFVLALGAVALGDDTAFAQADDDRDNRKTTTEPKEPPVGDSGDIPSGTTNGPGTTEPDPAAPREKSGDEK
jgi:hypothetical protein